MKKITKYTSEKFEIVNIEKKQGEFITPEGRNVNYTIYNVNFKHKDQPLVYRAKVDRVFAEYIEDILSDAVAESDNASDFWEK